MFEKILLEAGNPCCRLSIGRRQLMGMIDERKVLLVVLVLGIVAEKGPRTAFQYMDRTKSSATLEMQLGLVGSSDGTWFARIKSSFPNCRKYLASISFVVSKRVILEFEPVDVAPGECLKYWGFQGTAPIMWPLMITLELCYYHYVVNMALLV